MGAIAATLCCSRTPTVMPSRRSMKCVNPELWHRLNGELPFPVRVPFHLLLCAKLIALFFMLRTVLASTTPCPARGCLLVTYRSEPPTLHQAKSNELINYYLQKTTSPAINYPKARFTSNRTKRLKSSFQTSDF
ncbi:hypothetical protein BS78_06G027600 [Paspalum vaginatum]|nr:hypothetical protein BS78_06G027600 [Paspalum vaginatum]